MFSEGLVHRLRAVSFDCAAGSRDIIRPEVDGLLVPPGIEVATPDARDAGELLPIQRDDTFPKWVNLFDFRDTEKFAARMGLRA